MAERHAASAISGVGKVTDEVWKVRMDAAAAVAEAKVEQVTVAIQIASFFVQAEASAAQAVQTMETHVQKMAVHSDAQTSRVAGEVTQ